MEALLLALSDASRRTMLDRLRGGPAKAGELGVGLGISQPAASRHLRVLREAGLVSVEAVGRQRLYRLDPAALAQIDEWIRPYRDLWAQRFDALDTEIARGRKQARVPAQESRHHQPTEESA